MPTFEEVETVCFAEKKEAWRSDGPEHNWRSTLDRYVLLKIGGIPVDKVDSAAVYEVLRPIALAGKQATVKVAGATITAVLDWRGSRNSFGGLTGGNGAVPAAEAGDPVHRADGFPEGGDVAGELGPVRPGGRGVGHSGGARPGAMMGNSMMTQALRTSRIAASGHGFRSCFK